MIRKIGTGVLLVVALACGVLAFTTNHSYVTTPSMYPTIPPGSEIFVSPAKAYHVGDVIEFRANGLVWAHRLVHINADGSLVTKGDNPENATDVFVPALTRKDLTGTTGHLRFGYRYVGKDVIGVVTHAPRWVGFPELIAHHPGYGLSWLRAELGLPGKLLLVVAVGALCLLPDVTGLRKGGPKDASAPVVPRQRAGSTALAAVAADTEAPSDAIPSAVAKAASASSSLQEGS